MRLNRLYNKRNKSIVPSTIITLIIVAMLVISGPAQAVQVNVNATDLTNRQVGETGFFYINVTIGANERVPLTSISLDGLPHINGSPGGALVFNVSDFNNVGDVKTRGNYNISLFERSGWIGGFGYGYGYENNTDAAPFIGYGNEHQFYGYGYGYGSDSAADYTKLVYKITVDTTGAQAGKYDVTVKVNAGNDVDGQNVSFQSALKFTLQSTTAAPAITGFAPASPVSDIVGATRTFNVTVNQTVNVTWYINGTQVQFNESVTDAVYTNNSASAGIWNVTSVAANANGSAVQKWVWIVETPPPNKIVAKIEIKPETLNLASKGKFTAFITLPEGFDAEDIDPGTVVCEGAPAVKGKVSKKDGSMFIAKFNRQDLVNVPVGNAVKLTVKGKLKDGTQFEGSDVIRVINSGKHHDDDENDEENNDYDDDHEKDHDEDRDEFHDSGDNHKQDKNTINIDIDNNNGDITIINNINSYNNVNSNNYNENKKENKGRSKGKGKK